MTTNAFDFTDPSSTCRSEGAASLTGTVSGNRSSTSVEALQEAKREPATSHRREKCVKIVKQIIAIIYFLFFYLLNIFVIDIVFFLL